MSTTLKYERIQINENKCRYSFEDESNDFETIEKLVVEHLPKDFSIKDLIFKTEPSEQSFFESKIKNLDIKEQILLEAIHEIKLSLKNEDSQIILFDTNKNEKTGNNEYNTSIEIFNEIDRMVHKALHKKKMINGKEIKDCIFYDDLNKQIIDLGENNKYKNIDNLISNLKKNNKSFEFIAIKSIMISLTNLMTELIQKYLAKNEKNVKNVQISDNLEENEKKIEFNFEKIEMNLIEANIFEDIYKDFISQSNICSSELEEYFINSLDSFREKYQMSFTLSELYTDIFWNSIFHNKKLCTLFLNSYFNEEIYGDIKICLTKILKSIFCARIPLKHQIVELLSLHQLENNEENDLMTLIVSSKNINHDKIIKSEKEKENLNKKNQKESEIENNPNSDKNSEEDNKMRDNNNIQAVETIKYNIITANDISVIKNKKQNTITTPEDNSDKNNKIITKENNIIKEKENKNKEKEDNNKNNLNKKKSKDNIPLDDIEHKTVDEIMNYINEDKIVKNKKKKKSRKNRKAKKEEPIIEENQEEIEDSIVVKFKKDLDENYTHAGKITKIKPIISEEWIKFISQLD